MPAICKDILTRTKSLSTLRLFTRWCTGRPITPAPPEQAPSPVIWFLTNQTHPSIFHQSLQVKQMLSVMQQLLPGIWRCCLDDEPLWLRLPHPPSTNIAGRTSELPVRQLIPQVDTPESRPNRRATNGLTRLWDSAHIFRPLCWFSEVRDRLLLIINSVNCVYESGLYRDTTDTPWPNSVTLSPYLSQSYKRTHGHNESPNL